MKFGPYHIIIIIVFFLQPQLWHMEVLTLGVRSELQQPAYPTVTANWVPSQDFNLHHSLQQQQIPDPLNKARDRTCILRDTLQIHFHWASTGTPQFYL